MRPGRLDRKIEIPLPNEQARMEILKIHAANITKHGDIDYEAVVKAGGKLQRRGPAQRVHRSWHVCNSGRAGLHCAGPAMLLPAAYCHLMRACPADRHVNASHAKMHPPGSGGYDEGRPKAGESRGPHARCRGESMHCIMLLRLITLACAA